MNIISINFNIAGDFWNPISLYNIVYSYRSFAVPYSVEVDTSTEFGCPWSWDTQKRRGYTTHVVALGEQFTVVHEHQMVKQYAPTRALAPFEKTFCITIEPAYYNVNEWRRPSTVYHAAGEDYQPYAFTGIPRLYLKSRKETGTT